MAGRRGAVVLRPMTPQDVEVVLDIQQPASVAGLADVFPQDRYPFPRELVGRRWREEIVAPGTDCFVVLDGDAPVGFAAVRQDEVLHFGIAVELWGTGTAGSALDAVLGHMRRSGVRTAWLWVFTDNARGRRFYERSGWRATGARRRSDVAPYAELLRYELELDQG